MELLFWIGFLLLLGYISRLISKKYRIPSITLYLIVGMLLSPNVSNILPKSFISHIDWIIDFSVALIAFIIGGSVKLKVLNESKKIISFITFFQAQVAFVFTSIVLYFILPLFIANSSSLSDFSFYFMLSVFLGALASTTSPTTTLAIIQEYKSAGVLTSTLIAVVAIDDIFAIANYSVAYAVNLSLLNESAKEMLSVLGLATLDIFASFFLGVVFAYLTIFIVNKVKSKSLISIALGNILLAYSIAHFMHLEALLSIMVFGFVLANKSEYFENIFSELERVYLDVVFMLFFMVSGTHINLEQVQNLWHIALIYVVLRAIGKLSGVYIGATLSKAQPKIKEYLGFALLPQAGVALGLAMLILKEFPNEQIPIIVFNIILVATIVHELVGPFFTKYALCKVNEAKNC